MSRRKQTFSGRPAWAVLRLIAVFLPVYLYVWLGVDPLLVHHGQCPIFQLGAGFLGEFLGRTAGAVEYVSALLGQLYAWAWAGAMVMAAAILAACLAGGAFLSAAAPGAGWIGLFAAAPLVSLHSLYHYPLHVTLAVGAALAAAAVYVRLPLRGSPLRLAAFLLLSAAVYHLAGAAMLLFAALCGLHELLVARRWVAGSVGVAVAAALPYAAARCVLLLDVPAAYRLALPLLYEIGVPVASIALYALFPLAAVALALREPIASLARGLRRRLRAQPASAGRASESAGTSRRRGPLRWAVGTLAIMAVCAASAWASFDPGGRRVLRIDYLARRGDWPGVLREARRLGLGRFDPRVIHDVDRALFHTGRLPDEMFAYPHKLGMPGLTLYVGSRHIPADGRTCMKTGDLFFELGHVNEAEHMAYEALELLGERPHLLKRLFLVYVLKGQPVAARTYLAALEKSPLHAAEARRYRRLLEEDPNLPHLEAVRQARVRMPHMDGAPWPTAEQLLLHLLYANPRNRMAFEYLMAHYLLSRQPGKVTANIGRLRVFEATDIPRHYAEALMLHSYQLRARGVVRPIPLHGLRIDRGLQRRLEEFLRIRSRFGNDRLAAREALKDDFGDTYFFYHTFGLTTGGKE